MIDGNEISSWARDGATLIVAITALVTALGLHCDQRQVSQQHGQEIQRNTDAIGVIEKKADQAAQKVQEVEKAVKDK